MKTRLITLLTLCHTLDRAKDRTGAYTLRNVNKFPKFKPVARASSAAAAGPPAAQAPLAAQSSLFQAPIAPVAAAQAKASPKGAPRAITPNPANQPDPTDRSDPTDRTDKTDRIDRTDQPLTTVQPNPPGQPAARKVTFLWFAKFSAFLAGVLAFVPRTAARIRGRLRSLPADALPRAQAELALEKVTVLRNDLSDADLVVVAVQPKTGDSRADPAGPCQPSANPWTRVTARWDKAKSPPPNNTLAQSPP
jgi:hypothetical protein